MIEISMFVNLTACAMQANASWLDSGKADTDILTTTNRTCRFSNQNRFFSVVNYLRKLHYLPNPKSAPDLIIHT